MDIAMEVDSVPAPVEEAGWGDALRGPFEALACGDSSALETIWEVAGRRLYALALWRTGSPDDARDVVQEVFVRLASRRGELPGVATPHGWLLAVTHHAAVDVVRRRGRRQTEPLESAALVEAQYQVGAATQLDLLDATRALADAETAEALGQLGLDMAHMQLEQVLRIPIGAPGSTGNGASASGDTSSAATGGEGGM